MMSFTTALRWIARIWSVAALLFVFAIVIGQVNSLGPWPTAREWAGLVFFPIGVAAGLVIAFFSERLGGWLTVASVAGF